MNNGKNEPKKKVGFMERQIIKFTKEQRHTSIDCRPSEEKTERQRELEDANQLRQAEIAQA